MKRLLIIALMSSGFFALQSHQALAAQYQIDVVHSNVGFTIRHIVSRVNGEFKEFDGSFSFDPAKPESSALNVKIKASSIDTKIDKRDEHLKSADFFDVEKHPEILFVSKKISKSGKNKYKVTGDLTLRGVSKPVVLDVEYLGSSPFSMDGKTIQKAGFTAHTVIQRKDFGISWNKTLDQGGLVLGDEVDININIEANQQ